MATTTYLSNAKVLIATVDLSDQCKSATITRTIEALESSAFGSTNRVYVGGMENSTFTGEFMMSYAASETYATLKDLVGTAITIVVNPTSAADSATNPGFTLTGTYLESIDVIAATIGELGMVTVSTQGGAYTADVTP
jgi:hypothetical protein